MSEQESWKESLSIKNFYFSGKKHINDLGSGKSFSEASFSKRLNMDFFNNFIDCFQKSINLGNQHTFGKVIKRNEETNEYGLSKSMFLNPIYLN